MQLLQWVGVGEAAGIYYSASAQLQFTTSSSCIIINQLAVSQAATTNTTTTTADTLNGQYVTPALSCCAHCTPPQPDCISYSQLASTLSIVTDLFRSRAALSRRPTLCFFLSRFALTSSIFACCNFCYAVLARSLHCEGDNAQLFCQFSPYPHYAVNLPLASEPTQRVHFAASLNVEWIIYVYKCAR